MFNLHLHSILDVTVPTRITTHTVLSTWTVIAVTLLSPQSDYWDVSTPGSKVLMREGNGGAEGTMNRYLKVRSDSAECHG